MVERRRAPEASTGVEAGPITRLAIGAALLIGVLTFLVYGPVLGTYFIADDFAWYVRDYSGLQDLLITHRGYMRPMGLLTVLAERALLGDSPVVPHVTNTLFHLGSTALVFQLTSRVAVSRRAGFAAALLFALHPMHSPTVCWISARFDLLCTLFLLAGLVQYDTYRRVGGWRPLVVSLVMFTLALFSKETALCAPLLAIAVDVVSGRRPTIRSAVPYGVLWMAYLALRYQAFGGLGGKVKDGQSLQFQTSISEFLTGLFVHPVLELLRPVNELWWGGIAPWLEVGVVVVTVVALGMTIRTADRRARAAALFGAAFLLITSVPAADRLADGLQAGILNGRYLYLPAVGYCVALGALLGSPGRASAMGLTALSALFFVTLAGNNLAWRKAGQISGAVVREADRLVSSYGLARPVLIVQDLPRVQDGAILFMTRTIHNALRFNGHEVIDVVEVPATPSRQLRRDVPDLRFHRPQNRIIAAQWDADAERLVDRTEHVRRRLLGVRKEGRSTVEWSGEELAKWLPPTGTDGEGSVGADEQGLRLPAERGATLLVSPPLPRGTRRVEMRLLAIPEGKEAGRGARSLQLDLLWRILPDRQPSPLERRVDRARALLPQDGSEHVLEFPVELRRLEDLEATHLECRLQSMGSQASVQIRSIRIVSGPAAGRAKQD